MWIYLSNDAAYRVGENLKQLHIKKISTQFLILLYIFSTLRGVISYKGTVQKT